MSLNNISDNGIQAARQAISNTICDLNFPACKESLAADIVRFSE
jgi:hypothetical protein